MHVLTNAPTCRRANAKVGGVRHVIHAAIKACHPARTHTHMSIIDTAFWAFLFRAHTRMHRHAFAGTH